MHEMKLESTRIMDPAMSPYHSGETTRQFEYWWRGVGIFVHVAKSHLNDNTPLYYSACMPLHLNSHVFMSYCVHFIASFGIESSN